MYLVVGSRFFPRSNRFTANVPDRRCLLPGGGRDVLQQFLCSLVEPFHVFLLFFAEIKRVLGSPYPNELLCGRVIHAKDESPDVDG